MSGENRESTGGAVLVDPLGGLALDPSNELKFRGPFDDYVSVSLTIRNPTPKRIAFKIKTTAPKRYCVKPNSGVLDPDQNMKVNVLLQPFVYDPNEKNKHKFMVQYMYLNESEMQFSVNDILTMWKDVPASRLLDLKLKCIFELTESDQQRLAQQQTQQQLQTTAASSPVEATKSQTVGSSESASSLAPTATAIKNVKSSASNVSSTSFSKDNYVAAASDFDSTFAPAKQATSSPVAANTTVTAASRVDKNDNTLNELKMLRQQNETLQKEVSRLKEEESRLRKLALQAPSSTLHKAPPADALTDLLNNRSTLIIIVLLAIVVYLLLFR